jgi:hypothetical protein
MDIAPNTMSSPAPLEVAVLEGEQVEATPAEIIRFLGYPVDAVPNPQITERAARVAAEARGKLRARGIYSVYPVSSWNAHSIALAGGDTFVGPIGEFLGNSERVAVFVVTAGPEVVQMGEDAAQRGDVLDNLIFHALGAATAEAMGDRLAAHLQTRCGPGQALTLRFSPGYCGITLQQQRKLFRLVDAARIGVELMPSLIMKPIKSVSGLIGIGPESGIMAYGNPCPKCPMTNCAMRR